MPYRINKIVLVSCFIFIYLDNIIEFLVGSKPFHFPFVIFYDFM